MPLLVNSVPNLAQGVSQQPDNLRYPGQCDEQINAWATVVEGLVKRPNTRHIHKLFTSAISDDAYVQYINRDDDNQFAAVIQNNDVSLFDLSDGTEKTVSISANAQTYLNGITTPRTDVKALTVADYTFIANKQQTVSLSSTLSSTLPYEALVFVKLGDYSKEYSVEINGQKFIYESGDGQNAGSDSTGNAEASGRAADTEYIAGQLAQTLGTGGQVTSVTITNGGSGYTTPPDVTFSNPATGTDNAEGYALLSGGVVTEVVVTHGGRKYTSAPTISFSTGSATATATIAATGVSQTVEVQNACIKITGTSDFQIGAKDGLADQGLGLVYKEVGNITDLPSKSFHGFRVKVRGDAELVQDDYYVKFEVHDEEAFGGGSWIEDVGYGIKTTINATTMPLQLKPDDTTFNTWTLDTATWGNRLAGDDDTNPAPTFVGSKVNDIFFFKNRLGFLTDNSIVFSEADEYFNFFRTTTQQLLDSAPIDVGLSHTKVAILKHAKAFQEKLMLFSDTSQFVLRGQDVLSPKTVAISPVSEYDVSDQVEPLALGNYIYFPFKRDNYEGMYEYFVDNNTEVFTAQEITEQVPRYIRSNVQRMAGSPIQNVICLKSDRGTEQDTLYVYKYFWSNNEKVQSAWQKFEFGHCTNICGFEFIDSTLYMLNHVGDVLQLEKLSFEDGHTETIHGFHSYRGDLGYPILLDSKIAQGLSAYTTQSYDALTNKTTISDVDIYIPESNESYELQLWTMNGAKYDITKGSEIPDELVHDGITYTAVDSGPSGLKVEIYPSPSSDMTYNSGTKTLVISLPSPITDRTQGDIKALYDAASANETDVFNLSFSDPNANLTSYLLDPTPLIRVSDSSFTVDGPIYDYVSYEGTIYKCILSHNSSLYPETSVRERRVGDPDPLKPGGTQSLWTTLSGDEAVLVTSAPEWQEDRWYQGPYEFVIGYAYGMLYRFSKQTLKQPTERGGRTKSDYTFQTIRTGSLEYSGSGAMQVEVYPKFRDPKRYPFNPTNLGSDSIINKFTPESGHFRFPIQTQAEELRLEVKNSSALPLRLLSAEFESMVVSRSKRYGA